MRSVIFLILGLDTYLQVCQNGKLRCGYSPDLLAILQGNPGRTTPDLASVATLAVLAILRFPC